MAKTHRIIVVSRPSAYDCVLAEHATFGQAEFFLKCRGQSIDELVEQHQRVDSTLTRAMQAIPVQWRRAHVLREHLDRFLFEPEDLIVTVGQDGLVANVAKYLNGQPVIGINPDAARFDGVLVRHDVAALSDLLQDFVTGRAQFEWRSMVEAELDGMRLRALNELFVGHRTHQSARYTITHAERSERQSSSGLIVATGTGSTGWARSIHEQRRTELELPAPEEQRLSFFVREAFPSVSTGTSLTEGDVERSDVLTVRSEMDDGVVFGDGIEDDRLDFSWGRELRVSLSETTLNLMV